MKRRRRNREIESYGLSFLDAICCGFGAIVLLLVITKTAVPTRVQDQGQGSQRLAAELAQRLPKLEKKRQSLAARLAAQKKQRAAARARLAELAPKAKRAAKQRAQDKLNSQAASVIEKRLARARQKLTTKMERLNAARFHRKDRTIGGIPVDSQYIIFVIDTSGSMQAAAWPLVIEKMRETLAIYPQVKGIQVMSDMGKYLYPSYAGQWIPDTAGRRKVIVERLASWRPFSNSSPVEGIERAIRAFGKRGRQVSIYVLGDEFTGASIQAVLDRVARINPHDDSGRPLVRIHGLGFPTQFSRHGGVHSTGVRFAALMRALCHANGGTFVGLHGLH